MERVYLMATRDIQIGQEIFCSYGKKYWSENKINPIQLNTSIKLLPDQTTTGKGTTEKGTTGKATTGKGTTGIYYYYFK